MKPVLIQYLHKKNKGKYKAIPVSKQEQQHLDDRAASFVMWALAIIVMLALITN